MTDNLTRDEVDAVLFNGRDALDDLMTSPKFPVSNRLRAQIDDCKKQVGKLNTKRDMLLRQIETLEEAVRELEKRGAEGQQNETK